MIVGQLDIHGLGTVEPEHDAPVGAHADAPLAGPVAAQPVKPVPRQVEVAGPFGDLDRMRRMRGTRSGGSPRARSRSKSARRPLCANLIAEIVSRSGTFHSAATSPGARQPAASPP